MAMNTNKVLIWLKNFKYTWLLQNILNDPHLIELISNKLHELEQLLLQDHLDENEIPMENEDQCDKISDKDVIVISTTQCSLPIPSDIQTAIENENYKSEEFNRPAIRLKRIPLAEAEEYLPSTWKIPKSKRGRKKRRKSLIMSYSTRKKTKKHTQTTKSIPPPPSPKIQDETAIKSNNVRRSTRSKIPRRPPSTPAITSIQSKNDEKKKGKRKLRAIDAEDDDLYTLGNISQTENSNLNNDCDQVSRYLGQNGILSQTRKANETRTYHDDFTLKLHSRQSIQEKNKSSNSTTIVETVHIDDIVPLEDQQMLDNILENHDNDSLFTSLELTHDKTIETSPTSNNNSALNYDDCIEDITNDGIDPPLTSSSPTLDHISFTT